MSLASAWTSFKVWAGEWQRCSGWGGRMAWFVVRFVCGLRRKQILGKKPLAEEMQKAFFWAFHCPHNSTWSPNNLESGLRTRAGVEALPMLGNLGLGPVCGGWGWRNVYGKSMMGMELLETRLTLLLRSTPNPRTEVWICSTFLSYRNTHNLFVDFPRRFRLHIYPHIHSFFSFIYSSINIHWRK